MGEINKNYMKWVIGLAIVIAVTILLGLWLWPKHNQEEYDQVFEENLQAMLQGAKQYYTDEKLPVNLDDSKTIELERMMDLEIISSLKDANKKTCNVKSSYVTITKTANKQYTLHANLVCNKKSGYKMDTFTLDNTTDVEKPDIEKPDDPTVKPEPTQYTVKFNSNGGTAVATQTITSGNSAKRPTNPTRSGYTFSGWYYNDAVYNFEAKINQNITLTAKWVKNTTSTGKTFYYEQAPVTKTYTSEWTAYFPNNSAFYETKKETADFYEWFKSDSKFVYSISYFTKSQYDAKKDANGTFTYKYTIQLKDVSAKDHFMFASRQFYYIQTTSTFQDYLDHRNEIALYDGSNSTFSIVVPASTMNNSALRSRNYDFDISKPYVKDNKVLVDIIVNVHGLGSTSPCKVDNVPEPVYFIGVKFSVHKSYVNEHYISHSGFDHPTSWPSATQGDFKYTKEVTLYRSFNYKIDNSKAIWSTKATLDGYQPTGRTKWE